MGRDIPAEWWSLFHSPELDAAVRASHCQQSQPDGGASLAQCGDGECEGADRRLLSASDRRAGRQPAEEFRRPVANLGVEHAVVQSLSGAAGRDLDLDLWGANRRQVEALQAEAEAQHYQLEATYVALTANVVAAAVQEASLRDQIAITNQMLAAERQILAIEQHQKGTGSDRRRGYCRTGSGSGPDRTGFAAAAETAG